MGSQNNAMLEELLSSLQRDDDDMILSGSRLRITSVLSTATFKLAWRSQSQGWSTFKLIWHLQRLTLRSFDNRLM